MKRIIFPSSPRILPLFAIVSLIAFCSCQQKKSAAESPRKKYSFHLGTKAGGEYIVQTDTLESGSINPLSGVKPTPSRHFYDLMARNGLYYYLEPKNGHFIRYEIKGKEFVQTGAVGLTGIKSIENLTWITKDSALLIGYDSKKSLTRFALIDAVKMTASEGVMDIPAPKAPYNWLSLGLVKLDPSQITVGYTYHISSGPGHFITSDTMYIEVLSFPGMKSISRFTDTRSTYPGGLNTMASYSFPDEKGDFYFVTTPGITGGNHPTKPTAIFRIKKGQQAPDPYYFFNISASAIKNHGYGFWYIGKGKAILRCERKDLYTGMGDHYKNPHFEFYLLDLQAQTTHKLDLPLDKGSSRQCVLVKGDTVYISVNSDAEGSYVWMFNPEKMTLKKGLKFTGDISYILRMERL